MHMLNALAAVLSAVVYYSVAVFKSQSFCYFGNLLKNMSYNRAVALVNFIRTADMLFWNNEHMYGSLRLEVVKREDLVVFIYFF